MDYTHISDLKINEEGLRDLYLKGLLSGEIYGPLTGKLSQDKPWLKYYTEEQIIDYYSKKNHGVSNLSIFDYMMKENHNHLDDVALYYFGAKITFRELEKRANQFAASVQEKGIKPGDIVTICMPNTPEAVYAFYGLNKIGVVANMIHPLSAENEIKEFLNEAKSKMVLTIDASLDKVAAIIDQTDVENAIVVTPDDSMPLPLKIGYKLKFKKKPLPKDERFSTFKQFMKNGKNKNVSSHEFAEDDIAVMLHTGGTTGRPKGVELTNTNFNSMVEQFKYNIDNFERGEKMLTIMPVFHGFGLCSSLHLPLSYGVGCILITKLEAKEIGNIFKKYHPNHILGVPTLFKGIIGAKDLQNEDMSYVKNIVSGGDLVKNSLEDRINNFFSSHNANVKLSKGYGLSEIVAGATFATGDYNNYGSNGIPMIGTNLKLVKPGTDEEVYIGEIGEICLKGPSMMKGYYNQPEETSQTLQNGWLHTGDIGSVQDSQLHFSTRRGDMIISSGINVYPNVVEQVIEDHDAVSMCAVVGVPDDYKGEIPKAYVVLKDGQEVTEKLEEEIKELCKQNLNRYSVPKAYEYVDELPQTLLGKITHGRLKEQSKAKVYAKVNSNQKVGNM